MAGSVLVMSRDTYQIIDGVGFSRKVGTVWKFVCCDCKLVHDVALAYEDGEVGIAMKRNQRATTMRRKKKVSVIV